MRLCKDCAFWKPESLGKNGEFDKCLWVDRDYSVSPIRGDLTAKDGGSAFCSTERKLGCGAEAKRYIPRPPGQKPARRMSAGWRTFFAVVGMLVLFCVVFGGVAYILTTVAPH